MPDTDHRGLAEALRRRALEGPGDTPAALRQALAARAAGGPAIEAPYDALAKQIGAASYRVTDAEIAAGLATLGSERAAFEIVATAALGAGLERWRRGMAALEEAADAAP
jgi:hypothetical protein